MKAALSLKRLAPLILEDKPEDLTRKDEMDWITKNSDAIAYIKLSLADEQALQFAAEDNAKVLWDKIRATYMGEASHREEKPCDNIWILDSGASCHMAKEPCVVQKNISPEVMDIYLADKNSKMMSQGTGNVSAKTTTSSPRTGRIQIPVLELNDVQNQIPVRRSERLKSKLMSVHLVNNVPNSYFEAENSANWKNWKLAMENELDSLDKHKVWEIVQKPAKSKLIKTKWVYSLKQDDAGKNIKIQSKACSSWF
ncbi:retrovirus-related Pol polyprotein from transposon TNT 1-94 [Trichonephila clavipes]|nr:retrovirus-related Pol polyprotein from transposon TNT 1-94 [Trichonephila clavipes]